MKIELKNGSIIEAPENVDVSGFRGYGIGFWWIEEEDEENDDSQ